MIYVADVCSQAIANVIIESRDFMSPLILIHRQYLTDATAHAAAGVHGDRPNRAGVILLMIFSV